MADQKIVTFLWFNDNAEEAATFYCSVFKGARILEVARCGKAGPGPEGSVLIVTFELLGQKFIALNGGPQFRFTEAVSLFIECDTQEEVDYYWSNLTSAGGQESACGWLKDRFGLSWQVCPRALPRMLADRDQEKAGRAMRAMMTMGKIDLAAIERAFRGA